jgi:hypothetical protein
LEFDMLPSPKVRRVLTTACIATVPALTACESDRTTSPRPATRETLALSQLSGRPLPALVDAFDVDSGGSTLHYENYVEAGQLTLTGAPAARYEVTVRFASYAVTSVNGVRSLRQVGTSREIDHGSVDRDANGNYVMTSAYIAPLTHTARPVSAGVQMAFRVPGEDQVLDLLYRIAPE